LGNGEGGIKRRWGDWERGGLGEKKMNVQHPTSNIERRMGKIEETAEGGMGKRAQS
jgi:hypothetical protein